MILVYNILMISGLILSLPFIIPVLFFSKKRKKNLRYRLGAVPKGFFPEKNAPRIWVHALSVGEVISAAPFVDQLKKEFSGCEIIFSATTLTGFETAVNLFEKHVRSIFFFPYDLIFCVKKIIKKADPDFVIIVETDIWPGFLWETKRLKIPVFLVNARLSKRSFKGYKKFGAFMKPVFNIFGKICVQSDIDKKRFLNLGIDSEKICITGNFKFDQLPDDIDDGKKQSLLKKLKIPPGKKIMVCGSTHEGEEEILKQVFGELKNKHDMVMIIAPRNPERWQNIVNLFKGCKIKAAGLGEIEKKGYKDKEVIVIDCIGLLKALYYLSHVSFVGGSLVPCGGHNPLEPASFGKPIIFGPYMTDFIEIAEKLKKNRGAIEVRNSKELKDAVSMFFTHPDKAETCGRKSSEVFCENKGAVKRAVRAIKKAPLFPPHIFPPEFI